MIDVCTLAVLSFLFLLVVTQCFAQDYTLPANYLDKQLTLANPDKANYADVDVLKAQDGLFYLYPTGGSNLPVYRSDNLVDWVFMGRVFRSVLLKDNGYSSLWGPSVFFDGLKYLLVFTAQKDNNKHSLYIAESNNPDGFYNNIQSLLTGNHLDGTIFEDINGSRWLVYSHKDMFNSQHIFTRNLNNGQELQLTNSKNSKFPSCGSATTSNSSVCIHEGPTVIKIGNWYYLFYSANYWVGPYYSIYWKRANTFECLKDNTFTFFGFRSTGGGCSVSEGIAYDGKNPDGLYTYGSGTVFESGSYYYHTLTVKKKNDDGSFGRQVWLSEQEFDVNGLPIKKMPRPNTKVEIYLDK